MAWTLGCGVRRHNSCPGVVANALSPPQRRLPCSCRVGGVLDTPDPRESLAARQPCVRARAVELWGCDGPSKVSGDRPFAFLGERTQVGKGCGVVYHCRNRSIYKPMRATRHETDGKYFGVKLPCLKCTT